MNWDFGSHHGPRAPPTAPGTVADPPFPSIPIQKDKHADFFNEMPKWSAQVHGKSSSFGYEIHKNLPTYRKVTNLEMCSCFQ